MALFVSMLRRRTFLRLRADGLVEPSREPDNSASAAMCFNGRLCCSIVRPDFDVAAADGATPEGTVFVGADVASLFWVAADDEPPPPPRLSDRPLIWSDSAAFNSAAN